MKNSKQIPQLSSSFSQVEEEQMSMAFCSWAFSLDHWLKKILTLIYFFHRSKKRILQSFHKFFFDYIFQENNFNVFVKDTFELNSGFISTTLEMFQIIIKMITQLSRLSMTLKTEQVLKLLRFLLSAFRLYFLIQKHMVHSNHRSGHGQDSEIAMQRLHFLILLLSQ